MVKRRVMLVDDHRLFREALRSMLETDPDIEVVAEAGDGEEALRRAAEVHPDVVCMDVRMPVLNGIEATRRLVAAQPGVRVIAVSSYTEKHLVQEMMNAGAVKYVSKDDAGTDLVSAIHGV